MFVDCRQFSRWTFIFFFCFVSLSSPTSVPYYFPAPLFLPLFLYRISPLSSSKWLAQLLCSVSYVEAGHGNYRSSSQCFLSSSSPAIIDIEFRAITSGKRYFHIMQPISPQSGYRYTVYFFSLSERIFFNISTQVCFSNERWSEI